MMTTWCRWKSDKVLLNGELFFQCDKNNTEDMALQLYRFLKIDYPKFHKMDSLSKNGFLLTEIIKTRVDISRFADDEIAMVFANNHSCSETDVKFEHSYLEDKTPSPALFVYTLPNIVTGEISIRNKWYGESSVYILPAFDAGFFENQAEILQAHTKALMAGWLQLLPETDAFIYFAEKTAEEPFSTKKILQAYHSL
ncbi:MAG: hypothetical protein KIS69_06335 [Bacteroidetes bacterium]|nr:hypothetical protein [Bacteroidota bacterium]MCB0850434.1 hypothetical protein [Bacteroidota bacterium]MCB8930485.1 hypothetical protein [Bacteroidia bacterium]MCW5931272.1 hypothetical protein [Bacteroidota bacterium]